MQQNKKTDIWVGIFVVLALLALVFLALKSANLLSLNIHQIYQLKAYFENVGGLKPGAAVKSSGVVVGRVKEVRLNDQVYMAEVLLNMNEVYVFPEDSSLQILTSGLLGEQYIGIQPGFSEVFWKDGDNTKNTQSALVLENLISRFLTSQAESLGNKN